MKKNSDFIDSSIEKNFQDEIDLENFIYFLLRNKALIGGVTFFSFLIGCVYSLTLKRVWEGQFQIVLNSEPSINSTLKAASLVSRGIRSNSNLQTQVGILKSPSVLMPIYDLVITRNKIENTTPQPFYKWKSNLNVELEKGTSILNISYRDTNKEIILPALKEISSTYQDYSGKSDKRSQSLTKSYLLNQINIFKERSRTSIKAAQNFAIDQNLIYLEKNNYSESSESMNSETNFEGSRTDLQPKFLGSILNIEQVRVAAANEIRLINLQLQKINELESSDYENLQYFGSSIPALAAEGLPQKLKKIEKRLIDLRTKYTEKNRSITSLLEQRKLTVDLLKSRAIKYLKVAKLEAESTMEATMRPKEVLLKYKELIREADRNEKTLISLENDLRKLQLQQAKTPEPWQLITQPTLLNNPVAPSRKTYAAGGLIFGLFIGLLVSIYRDYKSGRIFSFQKLEQLLSTSILERINKNNQIIESQQIIFLKEFIRDKDAKKIAFISLEEINKSYMQKLIDFISKETNLKTKINLISTQFALEEIKEADFGILFTSLGYACFSEIKTLNSRINSLNIDLKGVILLEE